MKLTFHQFRDQLSKKKKGLQYNPGFNQYKGDECMQMNTRKSKAKRAAVAKQKKIQEKKAEAETVDIATPVTQGNLLTHGLKLKSMAGPPRKKAALMDLLPRSVRPGQEG
jgi:sRNA-binding protein